MVEQQVWACTDKLIPPMRTCTREMFPSIHSGSAPACRPACLPFPDDTAVHSDQCIVSEIAETCRGQKLCTQILSWHTKAYEHMSYTQKQKLVLNSCLEVSLRTKRNSFDNAKHEHAWSQMSACRVRQTVRSTHTSVPGQFDGQGINHTEAAGICAQLLSQLLVQGKASAAKCSNRTSILPISGEETSCLACRCQKRSEAA